MVAVRSDPSATRLLPFSDPWRDGFHRRGFATRADMRSTGSADPPLMFDAPARASDLDLSLGSGLTMAALGVVYGDIGTSPLYAVRQSLVDFGDMSEHAILGALSLIVWALA